MTKVAITPTVDPLLVRQSVAHMTDDQFAHYDSALREIDFYALTPAEQSNYLVAIQAANERRASTPLNVTIRDGNRAYPTMPQLPFGLQWTPLLAVAGVLVIVALMGRR